MIHSTITRQSSTVWLALCSILLSAAPALAQTGTISPSPYQVVLDANGNPVNNCKVYTYVAGSDTPATTYTTSALNVANANPIRCDSAGRYTAYLAPGSTYKFLITTSGDATLVTADNIAAVPSTSGNIDLLGTAGEALTAGNAVYLSDGSGSKTAGSWYKADATIPYSSTTPIVGFAMASIASAATGTIRISGTVTGLSSLTVGSGYYVSASSAGAITLTAPTNNARLLGVAPSTTTLVMSANPPVPAVDLSTCNGRLTLATGTPVTTADQTAKTTLYFAPYKGNRCALYDGTRWTMRTFAELSIAVPATTATNYDVWLYDNAGTLALELLAWTNATTRATALTTQDGVYVKTGVTTRRYLGTFRTTGVSGQTEDSVANRLVWNYYNRVPRALKVIDTTDTWTYMTATFRQANGSAANQVGVVVGVVESPVQLRAYAAASNDTAASVTFATAIGEDSAGSIVSQMMVPATSVVIGQRQPMMAEASRYPAAGYHAYLWLEYSAATGTTTWYGDDNFSGWQTGLVGWVEG